MAHAAEGRAHRRRAGADHQHDPHGRLHGVLVRLRDELVADAAGGARRAQPVHRRPGGLGAAAALRRRPGHRRLLSRDRAGLPRRVRRLARVAALRDAPHPLAAAADAALRARRRPRDAAVHRARRLALRRLGVRAAGAARRGPARAQGARALVRARQGTLVEDVRHAHRRLHPRGDHLDAHAGRLPHRDGVRRGQRRRRARAQRDRGDRRARRQHAVSGRAADRPVLRPAGAQGGLRPRAARPGDRGGGARGGGRGGAPRPPAPRPRCGRRPTRRRRSSRRPSRSTPTTGRSRRRRRAGIRRPPRRADDPGRARTTTRRDCRESRRGEARRGRGGVRAGVRDLACRGRPPRRRGCAAARRAGGRDRPRPRPRAGARRARASAAFSPTSCRRRCAASASGSATRCAGAAGRSSRSTTGSRAGFPAARRC